MPGVYLLVTRYEGSMRLIVILFMGLFVSALASAISDARHPSCVKAQGATAVVDKSAENGASREPSKGSARLLVCANK